MSIKKTPSLLALALMLSLPLAGCDDPQSKAEAYIKHGNELFDARQLDKAKIEYKNAAQLTPANADIYYRLGLVEEAQGHLREAFAAFTTAEQQNANHPETALKLAQFFLAGDQLEQSRKRISAVLALQPDNAEAHALLAALALRDKDYATAEKEARQALAKDAANITAYSVLTGLYTAQGDTAKAIVTVEESLSKHPQNPSLLLLKAAVYEKANDLPKLVETYQTLFKLKPNELSFRAALAAAYIKAGRADDAEKVLRDAVTEMPADIKAKKLFVKFLSEQRGAEATEKEIRDYMAKEPANEDYPFWLVDLYVAHKDASRAIALLEEAAAKNPDSKYGLTARAALARIAFSQGDKAKAEQIAKGVLEKSPGNLEALYIRAALEAERGDFIAATSDLRAIVRDNPKAANAHLLLSEVLLSQGRIDLAIETLNQLAEVDPTNVAAQTRLAQLYHMNGDTKRGLEILKTVTTSKPDYPVAWESTARLSIDTKDWSAADAAIAKLDALDGQHMTATFLKGFMAMAQDKTDDALVHYTTVFTANPSAPLAENALPEIVKAYAKTGQIDKAVSLIEALPNPSAPQKTLLAEVYMGLGRREDAAKTLDAVLAGQPKSQSPYLMRAKLYTDAKENDKALETLKNAVAASPTDIRAQVMQAQLLGTMGQYAQAIALYDAILTRNPGLDAVANNLAELIADYQHTDPAAMEKARTTAERFVGSDNPALLDTLAWVYFRLGDVQQAEMTMTRALDKGKERGGAFPAQMYYHAGAIHLKAGKKDLAKEELAKAIATQDVYPGLDDAKQLSSGL